MATYELKLEEVVGNTYAIAPAGFVMGPYKQFIAPGRGNYRVNATEVYPYDAFPELFAAASVDDISLAVSTVLERANRDIDALTTQLDDPILRADIAANETQAVTIANELRAKAALASATIKCCKRVMDWANQRETERVVTAANVPPKRRAPKAPGEGIQNVDVSGNPEGQGTGQ